MELTTRDSVAAAVLGTVAALLVLLSVSEARGVWDDPETYRRLYGLAPAEYAAQSYRAAALFAVPLVVAVLAFVDRRRRRLWRALVYVGLVVLVAALVRGCWEGAASGWDH